jgi:hypothetical protein
MGNRLRGNGCDLTTIRTMPLQNLFVTAMFNRRQAAAPRRIRAGRQLARSPRTRSDGARVVAALPVGRASRRHSIGYLVGLR